MTRITEDMLARARWMASRGESWSAIARELGVKRQGLRRLVERGYTKATETRGQKARVLRRRKNGESLKEITAAEKLTLSQVRYALR